MGTASLYTKWRSMILWLFFSLLVTFQVEAGVLEGTVKGQNGQLKKFVRVEIGGPETKTIFTDKRGMFLIRLNGGEYTITISQKNKSKQFKVEVPTDDDSKETFKLSW